MSSPDEVFVSRPCYSRHTSPDALGDVFAARPFYPRHTTSPATQMARGNMRVAKPRSANHSPRDAMMAMGRQSGMNESAQATRRHLALIQEQARLGVAMMTSARPPLPSRTRPTSWHPSSVYLTPPAHVPPPPPTQQYPYPSASMGMSLSPSSLVHSTHQSPASCSSYYDGDTLDPPLFPWAPSSSSSSSSHMSSARAPPPMTSVPIPPATLPAPTHISESILGAHYDWNHFVSHGFSTDPPTPNSWIHPQHAAPKLAPEESDDALVVEESTGPTLVGLGLYDDPPKALSPAVDPYQTMMTPTLLGSLCCPAQPGRQALKLEETWAPPSDGQDATS